MTDARRLWTAGSVAPAPLAAREVQARAAALRRKIWRSHAAEYAAGVFVVAFFTAGAALPGWLRLPPVSRIGAAMIACACVFVLTYLALRGSPAASPRDGSTLATYRAELARRRRLLATVVTWYLAPFWPGTAVFLAGIALDRAHAPGAVLALVVAILVVVATNVAIAWANRRAAAVLALELATLPMPVVEPVAD